MVFVFSIAIFIVNCFLVLKIWIKSLKIDALKKDWKCSSMFLISVSTFFRPFRSCPCPSWWSNPQLWTPSSSIRTSTCLCSCPRICWRSPQVRIHLCRKGRLHLHQLWCCWAEGWLWHRWVLQGGPSWWQNPDCYLHCQQGKFNFLLFRKTWFDVFVRFIPTYIYTKAVQNDTPCKHFSKLRA